MPRRYIKHGMTKTKLYRVWQSMIQRCENPNDKGFKNYGGRGINVSKRWKQSALNFIRDMGPRPDGMCLERKDNNAGYSKRNCVWASRKRQMRNTRRNRTVIFKGKKMCLTDWALRSGISYKILHKRLLIGWSFERAIKTPAGGITYGTKLPQGSHYRGVSKKRNKFRARFKGENLGVFETAEEAAMAYAARVSDESLPHD